MWVDRILKVPEQGHWYAVVKVDEEGETELITYLRNSWITELIKIEGRYEDPPHNNQGK